MRKLLIATMLAGAATLATTPALAKQGCGGGFHRGYHGRCVPNGRMVANRVVAGPVVLRIGGCYPGRGYWDGRSYYRTRYRHNGGWRYR